MQKLTKTLSGAVVVAMIGLSGCGGGGGGGSAASAPPSSNNNSNTVQGIATPSSVSVVTAQNASAGG